MRIEHSHDIPEDVYDDFNTTHHHEDLTQESSLPEKSPVFSVLYNLREFEGNTGELVGPEFAKKEYHTFHKERKLVVVHVGLTASAKTTVVSQDAYLLSRLLQDDHSSIKIRGVNAHYIGWGHYITQYLNTTNEQLGDQVDQNLDAMSKEFTRQVIRLTEKENSITYIDIPGVAGRAEETIEALADKPYALFRGVYTDETKRQEYMKFRERIHNTDPNAGPVIESIDQLKEELKLHGLVPDATVDENFLEYMRSNGAPLYRSRKLDADLQSIIADLVVQLQPIKISKEVIMQMLEQDPDARTEAIAHYLEYFLAKKHNIPADRRVVQENIHQEKVSFLANVLKNIEVTVGPGGILEL